MKTKSEYSRINFPLLRECRKRFKKNIAEHELYIQQNFDYIDNTFTDQSSIGVLMKEKSLLFVLALDRFTIKQPENYFIQNNILFDFLKNTDIKTNREIIKTAIIKNACFKKTLNGDNFYGFLGVIHSKNTDRSIFFDLELMENARTNKRTGEKEDSVSIVITNGNEKEWDCIANITDKLLNEISNSFLYDNTNEKTIVDNERSEKAINNFKLILNILFYMSAYPENILNQPPDERIENKIDPKNTKTITVSKEISDYLKDTELTPHLRRGHFRLLNSDYYKHKKGQVIFVRSSFVKGKAKTIIDNEKRNPAAG
jgi:hypothetical protein